MPGIQELVKAHPGLVFGVAGGAVLGIGYLLLKGKSGGGQASAFPPQYTLGGVTQGDTTATGTTRGSGGFVWPSNITRHPGPLPGPTPNPSPGVCPPGAVWDPITQRCVLLSSPPPDPRYYGPPLPIGGIGHGYGGGGTGFQFSPTIGASSGLYSNVLSDVTAQNNMNLSG